MTCEVVLPRPGDQWQTGMSFQLTTNCEDPINGHFAVIQLLGHGHAIDPDRRSDLLFRGLRKGAVRPTHEGVTSHSVTVLAVIHFQLAPTPQHLDDQLQSRD
jgi:hypothetical protein